MGPAISNSLRRWRSALEGRPRAHVDAVAVELQGQLQIWIAPIQLVVARPPLSSSLSPPPPPPGHSVWTPDAPEPALGGRAPRRRSNPHEVSAVVPRPGIPAVRGAPRAWHRARPLGRRPSIAPSQQSAPASRMAGTTVPTSSRVRAAAWAGTPRSSCDSTRPVLGVVRDQPALEPPRVRRLEQVASVVAHPPQRHGHAMRDDCVVAAGSAAARAVPIQLERVNGIAEDPGEHLHEQAGRERTAPAGATSPPRLEALPATDHTAWVLSSTRKTSLTIHQGRGHRPNRLVIFHLSGGKSTSTPCGSQGADSAGGG